MLCASLLGLVFFFSWQNVHIRICRDVMLRCDVDADCFELINLIYQFDVC
jgi:hypothetical protein